MYTYEIVWRIFLNRKVLSAIGRNCVVPWDTLFAPRWYFRSPTVENHCRDLICSGLFALLFAEFRARQWIEQNANNALIFLSRQSFCVEPLDKIDVCSEQPSRKTNYFVQQQITCVLGNIFLSLQCLTQRWTLIKDIRSYKHYYDCIARAVWQTSEHIKQV